LFSVNLIIVLSPLLFLAPSSVQVDEVSLSSRPLVVAALASFSVSWVSSLQNQRGIKLATTAIHTRTYRIPSDLRSQAGDGSVSTVVGDHTGIPGAVVFALIYGYIYSICSRSLGSILFALFFCSSLLQNLLVERARPSFNNQ
jgi:hypothetical protein